MTAETQRRRKEKLMSNGKKEEPPLWEKQRQVMMNVLNRTNTPIDASLENLVADVESLQREVQRMMNYLRFEIGISYDRDKREQKQDQEATKAGGAEEAAGEEEVDRRTAGQ